MTEIENIQPEKSLENVEQAERLESGALDEATHEPGARIEATQTFAQAESVEQELTAAVEAITPHGHPMVEPDEISQGSESGEGNSGVEATPINVPGPEMLSVEEQERLATGFQPGDGGDAATPIVIPDVQNQVEMEFDPVPEPPPDGQVMRDAGTGGWVGEMPEPGGDPPGPNMEEQIAHIDHWSEMPDPGGTPPGPNAEGGEDGGEATPINIP